MMNMKNMVSKIIMKVLPFCALLLALGACSKPFSLDLPLAVDSHSYNLAIASGEARIFFYTTKPWEVTLEPADCAWATLNRTSGDGTEDVEELILKYEENNQPDRQVTLVISAGDLQEKITMFQKGIYREWWNGSTTVDDLEIKPL